MIVGYKLFIDKYCIICISLYSQMYGYTVPGPSAEEVGHVCKVNAYTIKP